jgi:hypothetical protein
MSVAEILAELPKLTPKQLDRVLKRTAELRKLPVLVPSPELLNAIAEADAEPEENCIDIDEVHRIMESWSSKSSSRRKRSKISKR